MIETLITIIKFIIPIIGFGILVFFHELGHYLVAVLFKIKVEKFSIGMGPAIWSLKKGGTLYQIGAIPLGGFCQFKGDEIKDDLPTEIKYDLFNEILNKIKDQGKKDFLLNNYQLSLPDEIKNDNFNLLKNKNDEILTKYYIFNEESNIYNLNSEFEYKKDEQTLINIFKNTNINLLYYKLNDSIDKKTKKDIFKVISKNINAYKLRDPDSFFGSKPYKRLFVVLAGSFMNYLIAIIFLTFIGMMDHKEYIYPNKIVLSEDLIFDDNINDRVESPAKKYGLMTGDIILKINEKTIKNYDDIARIIYNSKNEVIIEINRNNNILTKNVQPIWSAEGSKYIIGITPFIDPVIKNNIKSKLQRELDLFDKDIIIGIDNYKENFNAVFFDEYLNYNYKINKKSVLYIKRDNQIIEKQIDFNKLKQKLSDKELALSYYIDYEIISGKNINKSFLSSFNESINIIKMTGIGLYSMIFKPNKKINKKLGGLVKTSYYLSEFTISGFEENFGQGIFNFFQFVSLISVSLAFFNLLPIPALDGGHVVMTSYELITGKTIKLKIMYIINLVFFLILLALGIIIMFSDIFWINDIY